MLTVCVQIEIPRSAAVEELGTACYEFAQT